MGGYALEDAKRWAASLSNEIKSGSYRSVAHKWLEGVDLNDPVSTVLVWATESNAFICSTVLPGGIEGVEDQDLSGDYYAAAVPVTELQVAKAGYR